MGVSHMLRRNIENRIAFAMLRDLGDHLPGRDHLPDIEPCGGNYPVGRAQQLRAF